MKFYSPLRFPGGKLKLLNYLSQIIIQNSPIDTYIEPFAGGAGAALGLLNKGFVKRIILNDLDEIIYKFWFVVLNDTERIIKKIADTSVSIEEWKRQKELLKDNEKRESLSDLEIGFAGFYLNRCNRSGIIRSEVGPIGGIDQSGKWKIGARYNKDDLIQRIRKVSALKPQITLDNLDAIDFMRNRLSELNIDKQRSIVYLDPPFYQFGPKLYRMHFKDNDHNKLHNYLRDELDIKWILSYDDVDFINTLYNDSKKNGVLINHFANRAKVGKELIILSDNCYYQNGLFPNFD